jgi:CRP-like cAMP-binding protein
VIGVTFAAAGWSGAGGEEGQLAQIVVVLVGVAVVLALGAGAIGTIRRRRAKQRVVSVPAMIAAALPAAGPALIPEALRRSLGTVKSTDLDLWSHLEHELDPVELRPQLATDVEVKIFRLRWGNDYAMVANPRKLLHFHLEVWEAEMLERMDGSRTVGEIIVDRLEDDGDLDAAGVTDLVSLLRAEGFLEPEPMNVEEHVRGHMDPSSLARQKLRSFAKTLSIDWRGADRFVRWCYEHMLRWVFTRTGALLTAVIGVAGFAAFIAVERWGRFSLDGANAPLQSLTLIALSFVLTFCHELGHASALVHYGRRVKSAGFMIYFGSPAWFVDASDGLMLDQLPRIVEAGAGPFAELVLSGVAAIALFLFPDSSLAPVLFKFTVLNYFVLFLNLIPLLELDGYFMLADLIQVPDLRERSLQFTQHDLWHKLRTRETFSKQEVGLALYSFLGIAFTIFSFYTAFFFWREIFGGLISSLWNGGAGSRVLLLVLALLVGGPAIRGLIGLLRTIIRRMRTLWLRVKFRIETSWRVEAAELIDALPAFDDLPANVLSDLAGRVRLRAYHAGQPVFRQGDRPAAFYVVRAGEVRVEEEDPDAGDTVVIRTLTRGDSFGELALLQSSPRTATVRAADEVQLFEVEKTTFDRLLADSIHAPQFTLTLQTMAELRDMPAFATLGSEGLSELLVHGSWITAVPGDLLVHQGAPGDAFYAIRSGQARVERDGTVLRDLGPGDHFGEIALLRDVPRTASVTARTPLRAFRLDREGFDHVVREAFGRGALKVPTDRTWQH